MSLKVTNKLTAHQRAILVKLEYIGSWDITIDEANKLIDELFAQKTQQGWTYDDMPDELKWLTDGQPINKYLIKGE